jgi:hypothetical protein
MTKALTSTEVTYALVEAKAVGQLTVTEDQDQVVITGPRADRDRARGVLMARGWHHTPFPEKDLWSC